MFPEITRFFSSDVRIINLQQRPRARKKRRKRKKKRKSERKKYTAANKGQRSSASSRQRYLGMTQKGEYQAVKEIYIDSGKVPRTSALGRNFESDISSVSRIATEGTSGNTRDRETEETRAVRSDCREMERCDERWCNNGRHREFPISPFRSYWRTVNSPNDNLKSCGKWGCVRSMTRGAAWRDVTAAPAVADSDRARRIYVQLYGTAAPSRPFSPMSDKSHPPRVRGERFLC